MASPFSDLPSELHTSLRSTWLQETRPASVLLGVPDDVEQAQDELSAIADLPQSVHQATTKEVANYLKERDEAVIDFVEALRSQTFGGFEEGESFEDVVDRLLSRHFESKSLPVSGDTLQRVVEKCVGTMITQWFSPMFTVWSEKLRKQGLEPAVLEIAWPEHFADRHIDFGEGMRNVELRINGKFNGAIGEDARDCTVVLDDIKGNVGDGARNCTFRADSIEGPILVNAKASHVICKDLKLPYIALAEGCSIKADTVKGVIRETPRYDDEDIMPCEPCSITIGHLTGFIEPGEGWIVSIGEITEPPKPNPLPRYTQSYGNTEYYNLDSGEDKNKINNSRYIQNISSKNKSDGDRYSYKSSETIEHKENRDNLYKKENIVGMLGQIAMRDIIQSSENKDD